MLFPGFIDFENYVLTFDALSSRSLVWDRTNSGSKHPNGSSSRYTGGYIQTHTNVPGGTTGGRWLV